MPINHRGEKDILRETITNIVYRTEYSSNFTGEKDPLQNVKIPTHITRKSAWETSYKPFTSRAVQLPLSKAKQPQLINLQGLEPRYMNCRRSKSATERHWQFFTSQNSRQSQRPLSGATTSSRLNTQELLQRPQSLVARRIQSQMSRFPKEFRYIDKQCFFHPAQEASKTFFVISPDWVSERQTIIRKNNVFS